MAMPHQQPQVLGTGGDVFPFLNVGLSAHVGPSQSAYVESMHKGPLKQLSPAAKQAFATLSLEPPAVSIHGTPGRGVAPPPYAPDLPHLA